MSALEWAYVAGFLDADGSITMVHRKSRKYTERKTGTYRGQIEPRMTFSNSNKEVILALADFLGITAHIYTAKNNATWPYRKPQWRLQLGGCKKMKIILENCLPYLIVKKDIAELVLKFAESRLGKKRKMRKGTGGRVGYSEEEWEILRKVRSLQGRKGWEHRLKKFQHPQDTAQS